MPSLGGWEFVILIGVLVLLFGARKLPDMARSIGQSARVFKGEMKGMKSDDEAREADKQAQPPQLPPPSAAPPAAAPTEGTQPAENRAPGRDAT
jgi:sec-independent protein translocase protein TatA